jgi:TRAP-type C4-dicarboxylate transport system permease small subunit
MALAMLAGLYQRSLMLVAINRVLIRVSYWFIAISTLCLVAMAILGTVDVLSLNIWGFPIPAATEMISSAMPIAIMMALSYTQITRSHISVDLFKKNFSPFANRVIDALSLVVGILVFFLMAWGAWQLALNSFDVDERAVAAIRFQIWPIKIIFSFGITICVLQMFFDLLLKIFPPSAEPTVV